MTGCYCRDYWRGAAASCRRLGGRKVGSRKGGERRVEEERELGITFRGSVGVALSGIIGM